LCRIVSYRVVLWLCCVVVVVVLYLFLCLPINICPVTPRCVWLCLCTLLLQFPQIESLYEDNRTLKQALETEAKRSSDQMHLLEQRIDEQAKMLEQHRTKEAEILQLLETLQKKQQMHAAAPTGPSHLAVAPTAAAVDFRAILKASGFETIALQLQSLQEDVGKLSRANSKTGRVSQYMVSCIDN
jgi:hypothetical protein